MKISRSWRLPPLMRLRNASNTSNATAVSTTNSQDNEKVENQQEEKVDPVRSWLENAGDHFKFMSTGSRRFVTGSQDVPFPLNPTFRPPKPISNKSKEEIFQLFLSNETKWTPIQLAKHFGISINRVMAILKLKSLEQQMKKQGKPIQDELVKGMEQLLQPVHLATQPKQPFESLRYVYATHLNPFFKFMDESESFTPEDAAALLRRQPFTNVQKKLDRTAPKSQPEQEKLAILKQDKTLGGKHDLMFVDTNSDQVWVRDRQGALRKATKLEKWQKKEAEKFVYVME